MRCSPTASLPESLGKVFGFHRAADTMGAVIGPLLGLAILTATDDDIGLALWIAVIPALISVALVSLTRETRPTAAHRTSGEAAVTKAYPKPATHAPLPRRVRTLAAVLGLFALVNFPDALILLRVNELGYSAAQVAGAYALFNLASAAIAYPAGALSDRWPRSRVYALGLACFAVGYIGLGLVDGGWAVVALLVVYGGFAGITDGVGKAWISALAPPDVRGHAQGLFQGLTGAGILVAGLWAGLLWTAGPGSGSRAAGGLGHRRRRVRPWAVAVRAPARSGCRGDVLGELSAPLDEGGEHAVRVVLPRPESHVRPGHRAGRERELAALPHRDDLTAQSICGGDHGFGLGQVR